MASAALARYSAAASAPSVLAISSAARSATVTASSSCWLHTRARPTRPKIRARRESLSGRSSSAIRSNAATSSCAARARAWEVRGEGLVHGVERRLLVETGDGGRDVEAEGALKGRGGSEELIRLRGQSRQATADHLPHPFGNSHLRDAVLGGPASFLVVKLPGLHEVEEDLTDEERVSFRLLGDRVA